MIIVNGTDRNYVTLTSGEQRVMTISTYPVFVIFPALSNLSATVYDSNDTESGHFSAAAAVFLSESTGRIAFVASVPTTFAYFSIRPPWNCPDYYLSSAPFETWTADQGGGNFTIENSQDVCLFHVSDNQTVATGTYNMETNFDLLYHQYSNSGSADQFYTGYGSFSDDANYFTMFRWHSDAAIPSKSIAIRLASPLSSLPYRQWQGSGTSPWPIILEEESPTPGDGSSSSKPSASTIVGIVIGCLVGVGLLCVAILQYTRMKRPRDALREPLELELSATWTANRPPPSHCV
jgi:hypothetical protein